MCDHRIEAYRGIAIKDVVRDVVERKDAYIYGFSEKLSLIMEKSKDEVKGFNVLSPPFNDVANTTRAMLYTDAVVINKMKFNKAGNDTKKAIFDFIKFFTGKTGLFNKGLWVEKNKLIVTQKEKVNQWL